MSINQSSLLINYINQIPAQKNMQPQFEMPVYQEIQSDSVEIKKGKKAKVAKTALLCGTALSLGVAAAASFRQKGFIKSVKRMPQKIKEFFGAQTQKTQDIMHEAKKATENISDYQKGANNITNAKDSLLRHYLLKIPGYGKFDRWSSNVYKKAMNSTLTKSWNKARTAQNEAADVIKKAAKSNLDDVSSSRLNELLNKKAAGIRELTDSGKISNRMGELDKATNRLDKDALSRLKDIDREDIKKLSKEALSELKLNKAKELQQANLGKLKNAGLSADETEELKGLVDKALLNADDKTKGLVKKAQKTFQKAYTKEETDAFEKLRDINCGSAPSDILGVLATAGTLGIYTAQADSKEERVGVSLTTGIPLLVLMGTTIAAAIKMVSGAKALVIGGATGLAANIIGNKINKAYQKNHGIEEPAKTIVTIDDYKQKAIDKGEKIFHG